MKFATILVIAALALVGCSTTKSVNPIPQASDRTDDGGGGGGAPPMTFDASAAGSTVSVSLDNFNATGAFAYQFTFKLSGGLALNGTPSQAVTAGSWLNGSTIFSATANQDGSITVVGARLVGQGDCATTGGVLANIAITGHGTLTLVASPQGAVTPSPDLQDCSNSPLPIQYGTASVTL